MEKVVVITGATAGIGRATTREFARRGYKIGLLARDKKRLQATKAEVEKLGGKAIAIATDVSDPKAVEGAAGKIEQELGPIAIWINNAMTTVFSPVHKMSADEYKKVTEVTYLGYVYGTLSALKRMRKRNSGTIVQVGSALSYRAIPLQSAYCAAKFAIRGFTDSLRTELLHDKKDINLTMVQLPAHNTPQFSWSRTHVSKNPQPVPPIFQPEVAGRAIYWASQHPRREVTVGRPTAATVMMNKLFPGLVDVYLARSGYEAQMTSHTIGEGREGNLFKPVQGNFSAHGRFDKRAKSVSLQFQFEKIPIIHYVTDFLFGIMQSAKMSMTFIRKQLLT